jgi:hypothetical protein
LAGGVPHLRRSNHALFGRRKFDVLAPCRDRGVEWPPQTAAGVD